MKTSVDASGKLFMTLSARSFKTALLFSCAVGGGAALFFLGTRDNYRKAHWNQLKRQNDNLLMLCTNLDNALLAMVQGEDVDDVLTKLHEDNTFLELIQDV